MSDLAETSASTGPCPTPNPGFCGIESFLLESLPDVDECALQLNSVEEDPPGPVPAPVPQLRRQLFLLLPSRL